MKLEIIAASGDTVGCKGGLCPTVYRSEDGRYFVQGFNVSDDVRSVVALASNESLVEISSELIDSLTTRVK